MNGPQQAVHLDGSSLTIEEVVRFARFTVPVEIDPSVRGRLNTTSDIVRKTVEAATRHAADPLASSENRGVNAEVNAKKLAIYGVTTGFGALKANFLRDEQSARQLQENIVLSHASGVGEPLDDEATRAAMLLRAHTLASGYCGVRFELVAQLVKMLNCGALPVIPQQGSVGASGDLAPLAHLALGVIGKGPVRFMGKVYPDLKTLKADNPTEAGIQSIDSDFKLSFKEGLALVNGIEVTTGIAVLNLKRAAELLLWADVIGSMTAEAIKGAPRAFDQIIFRRIYGHKGAAVSAANVRHMTKGSSLMNGSEDVHDQYSVRCLPQVHGAVRDVLRFVETTVSNHVRSIDDDPVFFTPEEVAECPPEGDDWLDRLHFEPGHFHGAPVGYAMDFLGISMADLGSISERRTSLLVDKNQNRGEGQVPGFLTYSKDGTTSGLMIAQYAAAALVSENKIHAHPASVDSIPTSANSEDHVSMSTIAARKARTIIANTESVLAIEFLCAAVALAFRVGDLRTDQPPQPCVLGEGTKELYNLAKSRLDGFRAFDGRDTTLYDKIEIAKQVMRSAPPTIVELQ